MKYKRDEEEKTNPKEEANINKDAKGQEMKNEMEEEVDDNDDEEGEAKEGPQEKRGQRHYSPQCM